MVAPPHRRDITEQLLHRVRRGADAAANQPAAIRNSRAAFATLPGTIPVTNPRQPDQTLPTPIRIYRLDPNGAETPVSTVLVLTPSHRQRYRWETVNQNPQNGWPVLSGQFQIATADSHRTQRVRHAEAYQTHPDGRRTKTQVPDGLVNQVAPTTTLAEISQHLDMLEADGKTARAQLVEDLRPLIVSQARRSFSAIEYDHDDRCADGFVILIGAINLFASTDRPPVSLQDYLAQKIRRDIPRNAKPTGLHERVATLVKFVQNHHTPEQLTPDSLLIEYHQHLASVSRRSNRTTTEFSDAERHHAKMALRLAGEHATEPLSLNVASLDQSTHDDPDPLSETIPHPDGEAERQFRFRLGIAENLLEGSNYPDPVLLVPALLHLEASAKETGRWYPSQFRNDAMLGFVHAFGCLTDGGRRRWDSPTGLSKIYTDFLNTFSGAQQRRSNEAAWKVWLPSGHRWSPLPLEEQLRCLTAGAQAALELDMPVVHEQLTAYAEQLRNQPAQPPLRINGEASSSSARLSR